MESFAIIESIIFFILEFRSILYIEGYYTISFSECINIYYKSNQLVLDILAIIPLNLIISTKFNILQKLRILIFKGALNFDDEHFSLSILRLIRLLQTFRIIKLVSRLEIEYRFATNFINIFRSLLTLFCVTHWTACLWFWFNIKVVLKKK